MTLGKSNGHPSSSKFYLPVIIEMRWCDVNKTGKSKEAYDSRVLRSMYHMIS